MSAPTPETDALRSRIPDPIAIQEMIASHADMERQRDALLKALEAILTCYGRPTHASVLRSAIDRANEAIANVKSAKP